jgi:sugar lactone lactonase YvrE
MRRIVFLGAFVFLSALAPPPATADIIYEVSGGTNNGSVGAYYTNGTAINTALLTGLSDPVGIAADSAGNLYVTSAATTIAKYSSTGTLLNSSFITGLLYPDQMTIASGNLYVASQGINAIGKYPLAGGTANPNLISITNPQGVAIAPNGNIYVVNNTPGTNTGGNISEYTSSGALVGGGPLVSGLAFAQGIAIDSAGNLYVTVENSNEVNEYSSNGTLIANLITGLDNPIGIAIDGSDLFVSNYANGNGYIGEYTTSGQTVSSDFANVSDPYSLAIATVPEPGSAMLTGIVASIIALALWFRRRRHNALITSISHLSR